MDNNELIVKYLLNQMTPSERMEFESGLKTDQSLAQEVDLNKRMIEGIQLYAEEERMISSFKEQYDSEKQKNRVRRLVFMRIAAVALLLIAATWFLLFYFGPKKVSGGKIITNQVASVDLNKTPRSSKKVDNSKIYSPGKTQAVIKKDKIAECYTELPLYENAIENTLRSGNIEILSPKKSEKFLENADIVFNWKGLNEELHLSLINNKGKVFFEKQQVQTPFLLPIKLKEGLYYWQLEDKDEVIYVGKFLVN